MAGKLPILLSFYSLSNGTTTLTFGQVTHTSINDLSFTKYSRRKTFRTLLKLYRTRAHANQKIVLVFTSGKIETQTNRHGAFYVKTEEKAVRGRLERVLDKTGHEVRMIDGLYSTDIHYPAGDSIVVSDIDDTLVHSFISDKLLKLRTLMLTTMEKRKAVSRMQELLKNFITNGAVPIYLSNSEQNLYPLIYRFLKHNHFPGGPLFLRQMRRLRDVVLNIKIPPRNTHKVTTLEEILVLFPGKKFILMGDNTQGDVSIYLSAAEKHGQRIRYIIIRKVVDKRSDEKLIAAAREGLIERGTRFYYADEFPMSVEV